MPQGPPLVEVLAAGRNAQLTRRAASSVEAVGPSALAVAAVVCFAAIMMWMTGGGGERASAASSTPVNRGDVFTISDHEGLPADAGCDQLAYHAQMEMWTAALADDLLTFDCVFPILSMPPADSVLASVAPLRTGFVPLRYGDLLGELQRSGFEVCTEVRIAEPPGSGFVYGFVFHLRLGSCVGDTTEIEVVVREHVGVEQRDAAAQRASEREPSAMTLALGRWVLSIKELDGSGSVELETARVVGLGLGGVEV